MKNFLSGIIITLCLFCTAAYWPNERATVPVGSDVGDSNVTLTVGSSSRVQLFSTTLTGNKTITLSTTGAKNGDAFTVIRTGLGLFTLDLGGLKTLPSATAVSATVVFDGSAWRLMNYSLL
jgi:hypothetical protein